VTDNVIFPANRELDPAIPTLGSILRATGYRTSYVGKWHLSHAVEPDLEAYGFSDWQGNDRHCMGWAGTGWQYDPIIADQGVEWLRANAGATDRPWFLVVALEVGRRAPRREVAGPALLDLVAGQATPRADIPLTKTRLFAYLCDAEVLCDQVARASSPDEVRRPHRRDARDLGEPRRGILGLTLPERREGRVGLTLPARHRVPGGLTVADEQQAAGHG